MNNLTDKIFSTTGCPSQDILKRYIEGLLSVEEKRAVEMHLTDCDMCNDELEGLSYLSEPISIDNIVAEINLKIDNRLEKKTRDFGFFFKIAASITLIIGLSFIIYHNAVKKMDKVLVSDNIHIDSLEEISSEKKHKKSFDLEEKTVTISSIDDEEKIIVEKEMPAPYTINENTKEALNGKGYRNAETVQITATYDDVSDRDTKSDSEKEVSKPLKEKPAEHFNDAVPTGGATPPASKTQEAYKIPTSKEEGRYETDKKDKNRQKTNKLENTGNEREEDNTVKLAEAPEYETQADEEVVYTVITGDKSDLSENMIQLAINKAKNNQFKEALEIFETHKRETEKNTNALFYQALCFYKLNKTESAYKLLRKLEKDKKAELYNEIQWYYTLTLIAMNKKNEAIIRLNEIIISKSPYATEAEIELNKLK